MALDLNEESDVPEGLSFLKSVWEFEDTCEAESDERITALAVRGGSTFSELRWYPPVEAAKGSLSWVFRAKQPESVRTGP